MNVARIARAMSVVVAPGETGRRLRHFGDHAPTHAACLTIASRDSFMRQRYGVAHAIGHVRCTICARYAPHPTSASYHVDYEQRIEREANDFALRLLVPSGEVLKFSRAAANTSTARKSWRTCSKWHPS